MLDVFPLSYGFLVPQCLHTITVLSTNLFPSSLYLTGKPKCSHTGDLNGAGHSSSSAHHDHAVCGLNMRTTFFFNKSIRGSRVCRTEDIDPNGSRINDDPLHHYSSPSLNLHHQERRGYFHSACQHPLAQQISSACMLQLSAPPQRRKTSSTRHWMKQYPESPALKDSTCLVTSMLEWEPTMNPGLPA